MKAEFKLRYCECPDLGELGFQILHDMVGDDVQHCMTGQVVSHDCVEHIMIGAEISGVANELMALGSMWFVRGQFNDFPNAYHDAYQVIAYEVDSMVDYLENGYNLEFDCPLEKCDEMDNLKHILETAKESVDHFLPFLVRGYNNAAKAFESGIEANNTFRSIQQEIDDLLKDDIYEGAEITLTIENSVATAEMIQDEFYD